MKGLVTKLSGEEGVTVLYTSHDLNEVLETSSRGRILVFSDHGYDVVLAKQRQYLYIVHGFKQSSSSDDVPPPPFK